MPNHSLYRHPSMQLLRKAIAKEKRQQLIAAILLTIGSLIAIYFSFQKNSIITFLGIVTAIIGVRLVLKLIRQQNVDESYLVQLLFYQPKEIVWVYGIITQHQPFGFNTTKGGVLYFHLIDGNSISVGLSPKRLKQVSKFLNRLLPQAMFGYTEERARLYKRDPKLLCRN